MSNMRCKSFWPKGCMLIIWTLCFLTVHNAEQAQGGDVQKSAISPSEPSACTLRWKEEMISCRGINHTQLVEELSKIKLQLHSKKQVAEGRNLESSVTTESSVPEKAKNESTPEQNANNRPEVRELNIFTCDIPKLTASNLNSPSALEILNVVSSGVKEVRPDALSDHAQSLMRLVLTHNHLKALPEAIRNLTRLEVLDLTHNDIDHLPEGSLLFNLHRLRQLHLSHNKLGQILGAQARLGLQSAGLSLTVFNLEPLRESLTDLTLANNALAAFPEQFSRPFTRLSNLDLSSNIISDILPGGFQQMPHLQYLDLSGNLLKEFNPKSLSSSILALNLRGNPWNCTCDSKWILKGLHTNDSGVMMITPPTCSSPFYLRHQEITSLKESDICPTNESSSSSEVVFIGDDVDGTLKIALKSLHLLNVTVLNHQALIVSWIIDAEFYTSQNQSSNPLSWAITIHKTRDDPRFAKVTRMKLERYKEERRDWRPSESSYTELLHGLESDTQYTLCLVPIQDDHLFTRPDQCQHIKTPEESQQTTTALPSTTRTPSPTEAPTVPLHISTDDYEVQTKRVIMINEARRVLMSWNVTIHKRNMLNSRSKREALLLKPLGWKITYRKFAEENETEIVLVSPGGEPIQNFTNHYTVDNLDPGTGYTFCFRPLSNNEVKDSLKDDNGETHGPKIYPHSNLLHNPKVVSSTVRGWHQQQSPSSISDTNSVEGDDTSNFSLNEFSQPTLSSERPNLPDFPSNIPSVPSEIPERIPSNIPPLPNFPNPSSFDPRPPPPPQQPSGGNFVYTSTGERIFLPSSPGSSPFNLPSIIGPSIPVNPTQSQWSSSSHPILDIPTKPQQRFTYDFDDSSVETTSKQTFIYDFTTEASTTTTKEPQRFTYVTRRKRSVNSESKVSYEKNDGSGLAELCKEVVTLDENNIITPVAIASTVSTSSTVIIAIVFCCCCPRICRRKKSGWQGKSLPNKRKISTISNPTPVNVYTRQSSVVSGTTIVDDSNSDLKSIPSQISANGTTFIDGDNNGHQLMNGRSVSVTSSSGYLTPLPVSNGTVPDPDRIFSEAKLYLPSQKAYLNSVKDRLLHQHKDLKKEFHPGYDIPPTSSIKSLLGYDYPHPTPVNPIGSHTDSAAKPPVPGKAPIPSPSSSDSNYNASVSDPREVEPLRPEVNLNIPFNHNKSSDSSKKFNLARDHDANKSTEYNYINPDDVNTKPRTYIKNAPGRTRHRKFGSPVRLPDERVGIPAENNKDLKRHSHGAVPLQTPPHLSRSVPDLASAVGNQNTDNHSLSQPADMTAAARLNLLIGNQRKEEENGVLSLPTIHHEGPSSKGQASSASAEQLNEIGGYVNFPSSQNGKDKDHYHTWSSSRPNTPRSRPSLGEVVLTGGTLIEVPDGYVIPKPPKPTRSVRLLVPGEDKPIILDRNEIRSGKSSMDYNSPPTSPKVIKTVSPLPPIITSSRRDAEKSQITHLMTPEMDQNRIVISTG